MTRKSHAWKDLEEEHSGQSDQQVQRPEVGGKTGVLVPQTEGLCG